MKSKIKNKTLSQENIKSFNELINQFIEESERAAVILGAAKIDDLLHQLLDHFMVAHYASNDPLLGMDRPISTFSSRIDLCYRLGIIDEEFAKGLHLVRNIRNGFAHEVKDSRLNQSPHKDRIRQLALIFQNTTLFGDVREAFFSDMSESSANFFAATAILIMRLETIIIKIKPISPKGSFGIRLS